MVAEREPHQQGLESRVRQCSKRILRRIALAMTIGYVSFGGLSSCSNNPVYNVNVTGNVVGGNWKTESGLNVVLEKYTLITDNLGEIEVLYDPEVSETPYFDILYKADRGDKYRLKRFFIQNGKIHAFIDDIEIIKNNHD